MTDDTQPGIRAADEPQNTSPQAREIRDAVRRAAEMAKWLSEGSHLIAEAPAKEHAADLRTILSALPEGGRTPVADLRAALRDAVISLEELAAAWPKDSLPAGQVCVRMANAINNGNALIAASPPSHTGGGT